MCVCTHTPHALDENKTKMCKDPENYPGQLCGDA